jgi:hypothetical protein
MQNPWLKYDYKKLSTVHPLDQDLFDKVNERLRRRGSDYVLSNKNVALPYFGNPDANLVLLYANPGLDPKQTKKEETPGLVELFDLARKHKLKGSEAFVFLREEFEDTPGFIWWEKTLKFVFKRFSEPHSRERALRNIFSAEIHPYKSVKYGALTKKEGSFPSSEYTYHLVQRAIDRGAVILIARAKNEWFQAVPALTTYDNVIYLSSAQQSAISPNNAIDKIRGYEMEKAKNFAWQLITKEALIREPGSKVEKPF